MWRKALHSCSRKYVKLSIFLILLDVFFDSGICKVSAVYAQENNESNSKMPQVVTPLVNSSPKSLYTPGKTNITEIPARGHNNEESETAEKLAESEKSEASEHFEEKKLTTSADFLRMKSQGFLSNIKNLLLDKNVKLSSVISELDNAKTDFESSEEEKTKSKNASFSDSEEEVSILRFEVNGQNLQPACYNLYFSGIEQNGAFLLTGDFRYSQGTKPCTETFYFLFTSEGTQNGKYVYKVTSAVNQILKNEDSPLIAVSKLEDLNAYKTGGFISIHDSNDDVAIDFLLTVKTSALSKKL